MCVFALESYVCHWHSQKKGKTGLYFQPWYFWSLYAYVECSANETQYSEHIMAQHVSCYCSVLGDHRRAKLNHSAFQNVSLLPSTATSQLGAIVKRLCTRLSADVHFEYRISIAKQCTYINTCTNMPPTPFVLQNKILAYPRLWRFHVCIHLFKHQNSVMCYIIKHWHSIISKGHWRAKCFLFFALVSFTFTIMKLLFLLWDGTS